MPGGDRVGEAYVDIHVNAGPGEAELAAFKAKVDRDFAELAHKKAEASLQLKSTEFDAKIDKAKQELDNLEHRKARASVALDKGKFDAEIAEAKAEIKALGREKAKVRLDLSQMRDANRETRLLAKGRELDERAALGQAKAERKIAQERARATNEIQRSGQVEARARAQNAKYDAERTTAAIKNRAEIARLSDEYEKLRGRQIGLEKSSRRVFSPKSIGVAEAEARRLERVASEADYLKHKIENLGGSVEHLDPQISHNSSMLDRWLSRLGDTSVRLGPVTTSIKGLATGLALLGPLVFELGGGVTSLVGTLGSGLAGAAVVAGGAFAGLATSALGVGLVMKPMIGEFEEVHKALEKVTKDQRKYGKGSEQVKTAQEQLQNTIKGVSPAARQSFRDYAKLRSAFESRTSGAKTAIFSGFEASLKTAKALLPEFASETVKTSQTASKAWSGWMQSLRSSEAKQILGGIMSDFRASIPGLASGFGSLIAMFGRLAAAGSHFLPSLSNGFADWANNLEHAVGGGKQLQSDVGGLVSQMRDLGHLAQDSGSLLVHIFSASSASGNGLVKSLDKVIRRWDKWTQTASGKNGLNEFFSDSQTATEDFMSSLGHMTKLLFEFSRATAPVANGLLHIVTWIGDIVSAADGLVGVKQVFQGLGLVLAGLFVASKVAAFGDAIQGVLVRLGLMEATTTEDAAAVDALTGALAANTAALEAQAAAASGAAVATGELGVATAEADVAMGAGLAEGAAGAGVALEGTAASAGLLSAALAPEVLIPAAVIGGLVLLGTQAEGVGSSFDQAREQSAAAQRQWSSSVGTLVSDSKNINDAYQRNQKASKELKKAEEATIQTINKHGATSKEATAAIGKQEEAERRSVTAQRNVYQQAKANVKAANEVVKTTEANVKAKQRELHTAQQGIGAHAAGRAGMVPGVPDPHEAEHVAEAVKRMAAAEREARNAAREMAVANIVNQREAKGLAPISDKTAESLQRLSKTIGVAATKRIGNFVNPGDVAKVSNLSNKLTKLGQGRQVKQIDVQSHGADQTLAKLQRLQKQSQRVSGATTRLTVKSNDSDANQSLRKLARLSQSLTGSRPTLHILGNAANAEQAINQLHAHLMAVINHQYKAELKAEDKSGAAASAFHHNMTRAATGRYNARITAVDDASSKAKSAEGNLKGIPKQTNARITVTSNAQAAASAANAAISSVQGKTVTIQVNTVHTGGKMAGGPGMYVPNFLDGTSAKEQREAQKAAERANVVIGGTSRRVMRPTMLVGEQSPQHPEYVIATNPAYREANRQYLQDAAGDLGYEVIPAYKKGKGKAKKSGGKSGGSAPAETAAEKREKTLSHHPPNPKHRPHKIAKVEKWGPVAAYNAAETDAQIKEEIYGQVFSHDEAEIKAGRMDNWEFARLRGLLADEVSDYHKLGNLVPDIKNSVNQELGHIHGLIDGSGEFSKKTIRGLTRGISHEKAKLSKLKKGKNESDASFRKRKRPFEHSITSMETEQHKKEKERERLMEIRAEAKQELSEVTGARKMNESKTNAERAEDDLQYVEDVESGAVEAPYAENEEPEEVLIEESQAFKRAKADLVDAGLRGDVAGEEAARQHMIEITEGEYAAAKNTPSAEDDIEIGERLKSLREETKDNGGKGTIGEQTASYNEAREQLYQQFASNITNGDSGLAIRGGVSPMYATMAVAAPAPNYTPNALAKKIAKKTTEALGTSAGATINNVVNNFAAPPPDPHTWAKQQEFELGAIA